MTRASASSTSLSKKLQQAQTDESLKSIRLDRITIDSAISKSIIQLMYNHSHTRHWDSLEFAYCRGDVDIVIDSIFKRQRRLQAKKTPSSSQPSIWIDNFPKPGRTRRKNSKRMDAREAGPNPDGENLITIRRLVLHGRNEYLRVLSSIRNGLLSMHGRDKYNSLQLEELVVQAAITTSAAKHICDCIRETTLPSSQASRRTNFPRPSPSPERTSSHLQVLDLSRCYFVHNEAATILASGIRCASPHLKTLRLSNCALDGAQISTIVDALSASYKDRPSFDAGGIQELSLELNYSQEASIHSIAALLSNPNCRLRKLHMGQQFIGTQHVLDIVPIFEALTVQNTSLVCLDLKENFCNDEQMKSVGKMLELDNALIELDLSCIEIGDEGVKYVANALSRNHTLKRLYLQHNAAITNVGIRYLHDGIQSNTTLEILELRDDAAIYKSAAVAKNGVNGDNTVEDGTINSDDSQSRTSSRSIIDIDNIDVDNIDGEENGSNVSTPSNANAIDDDGYAIIKKIQYILCLNRAGRKHLRIPNSVPLSHWSVILEQAAAGGGGSTTTTKDYCIIRPDEARFGGIQNFDLVYHLLQGPALLHR